MKWGVPFYFALCVSKALWLAASACPLVALLCPYSLIIQMANVSQINLESQIMTSMMNQYSNAESFLVHKAA